MAGALRADSGHTARSLDKLCKLGYVLRTRSAEDKRAYALCLTPEGKAAFGAVKALFAQWDAQMLAPLEDGQRAALMEALRCVTQNKREAGPCTGTYFPL